MAKKRFSALLPYFLLWVLLPCAPLLAGAETFGRTWGEVVDTTGQSLRIKARDADKTEEEIFVGPYTEFRNVGSTDDIRIGEIVDVDYVEKDGRKEAVSVYVDRER